MDGCYYHRVPAVKRLMQEAEELREPTEQFFAQPLNDNLFEWHFTIRGPANSEFETGIYHGQIILSLYYPMKAPTFVIFTPNGRFQTNTEICLGNSGNSGQYSKWWQPASSLRTALLAIIDLMAHRSGAPGSLDYNVEERKVLAKKSQEWKCPQCGSIQNLVRQWTQPSRVYEVQQQINLEDETRTSETGTNDASGDSSAAAETGSTKDSVTMEGQAPEAVGPIPASPPEMTYSPSELPYPVYQRLMFGLRLPSPLGPSPTTRGPHHTPEDHVPTTEAGQVGNPTFLPPLTFSNSSLMQPIFASGTLKLTQQNPMSFSGFWPGQILPHPSGASERANPPSATRPLNSRPPADPQEASAQRRSDTELVVSAPQTISLGSNITSDDSSSELRCRNAAPQQNTSADSPAVEPAKDTAKDTDDLSHGEKCIICIFAALLIILALFMNPTKKDGVE